MGNIIHANFFRSTKCTTPTAYQYDYGQILKTNLSLPESYEVQFSNSSSKGTAITQIGNSDGVSIPDQMFLNGSPIYAWIFLHTGEDDGETEYMITIPIERRATPTNKKPVPVQQDAITQAIAALTSAVEQTGQDVEDANKAAEAAEAAQTAVEKMLVSSSAIEDLPAYSVPMGKLLNGYYTDSLELSSDGCHTAPIEFDESMVLVYKAPSVPIRITYGYMNNGTFVPKRFDDLSGSNSQTYNFYPQAPYADEIMDDAYNTEHNCFIVFGFATDIDETVFPCDCIVKSKNCNLDKMRALTLTNITSNLNRYKTLSGAVRYDDSVTPAVINAEAINYYSTFIPDTGDAVQNGRNTTPGGGALRQGAKYIYANGLALDAAFYKKVQTGRNASGNPTYTYVGIPWTADGGYTVGNLEEPIDSTGNSSKVYPRLIEIPKDATHFDLNVYGCQRPSTYLKYKYLDPIFLKFMPEICFYGEYDHGIIPKIQAAHAIKNALKLIGLSYNGSYLHTRYITFEYYRSTENSPTEKQFVGFPYGTKAAPGVSSSFYSYLSTFTFNGLGVNALILTARNTDYGYVCVDLVSLACGLPITQGAEWWLQTFSDKAELADKDTVWEVGDILVMQRYYGADHRELYTHNAIVVDKLQNPKTGNFAGYLMAESTNIWSRLYVQDRPGTTFSGTDPVGGAYIQRTWRIPFPFSDSPASIDLNYKFAIDIEKDPINNVDSLTFPPARSYWGDMVLMQDNNHTLRPEYTDTYAYVMYNGSSYGRIYCDKAYEYGALFVDTGNSYDAVGNTFKLSTASGYDSSSDYANSFLAGGILPRDGNGNLISGEYKFKLTNNPNASDYDDSDFSMPCSFKVFDWPDATLSADGKTLSNLNMSSFTEVWVRVIPVPKFNLPYANYMYLPLSDLIYDSNAGTYTLPDGYQFISRVKWRDNKYGCIEKRLRNEYSDQPEEDYDDYDPDA